MRWIPFPAAWICGVVMHFLYRPLGRPRFLRALLPVSENVWEHFKMAFWPLCAAMAFVGIKTGTPWASIMLACAVAVLHAIVMMTGLFYTYVCGLGAGHSLLWADIVSFVAVMAAGYHIGLRAMEICVPAAAGLLCAAALAVLAVLFDRFSENPPDLPLFRQGGL